MTLATILQVPGIHPITELSFKATKWQARDTLADFVEPALLRSWKQGQTEAVQAWQHADFASITTLRAAGLGWVPGLRETPGSVLLVPLHDCTGTLWAVQRLPDSFRTCNQDGFLRPSLNGMARVLGLHLWVGPAPVTHTPPKAIGITEYLHDAVDWHKATGIPVLVAFAPENLAVLAGMLRTAFASASVGIWARWPAQEHAARLAASQTCTHAVVQDAAPNPGEFWLWP